MAWFISMDMLRGSMPFGVLGRDRYGSCWERTAIMAAVMAAVDACDGN